MAAPDPITPLTPAEKKLVEHINKTSSREKVLAELKANLQVAVEVELATIPIYLYTYYSLIRNNESGAVISPEQLYANKAGGVIMSVAVEEMLHMSLSANILYALGGDPQLYGKAPAKYPTELPGHKPKGPPGPDGSSGEKIPLAPYSFDQLWHFLQIEYPETWDALPEDKDWQTIGQIYSYIRCLISTKFVTDKDFQHHARATAIQPFNYSPNNVDTAYPMSGFDPWTPAPPQAIPPAKPVSNLPAWASNPGGSGVAVFPNQPDSHSGKSELLCIENRRDAMEAIDTISDQGEGVSVPDVGDGPDDDPTKDEESHYFKFMTIQAQLAGYIGTREDLAKEPPPPLPVMPTMTVGQLQSAGVLADFPNSPASADYPDLYRQIAEFNSALFQYMLIMTETIYRVPAEHQKLFFNEGLHRSMIWVMDKYIRTIRGIPIPSGKHKGKMMGPLFENVSLGERKHSFAGLARYGNAAIDAANKIAEANPNGDLASSMGNVVYYIGVALTKQAPGGQSMHLPDVGQYWK